MDSTLPLPPPRRPHAWIVAPNAPADFFAALPDVHPLAAQVLHARGIATPDGARAFLQAPGDAADPFALPDMAQAVARIRQAVAAGEAIVVYGDYDCDGVTACALLFQTLTALGARARVYIPNRFEEGYGLNAGALDRLKAEGADLIITVDCGGRAMREAAHARQIGLDLIITDHHDLEAGELPFAVAVVDPKRPDSGAFQGLAGVGVAYRLAQALLAAAGVPAGGEDLPGSLLDLVAIGTVADVVPLLGENRQLVRGGLARINSAPRLGVEALIKAAGLKPGAITAAHIGFSLGPRLNAAGRLDTAMNAYDLLTATEPDWAAALAQALDERNAQRQAVTAETARSAEQLAFEGVAPDAVPALLFAASEDYNSGVIGLAAARLVERHYRPSIVAAIAGGEARGSCRSVAGLHITAALDECRDLLARHGGHAAAAGFTARAEDVDALCGRLLDIARREQPPGGWTRAIRADAEIRLEKLTPAT